MNSYEEWTRSEIIRLRADAQKASADADTLQRTFDKWLESQGLPKEPTAHKGDVANGANGHGPVQRGRKLGHGSKNAEAIRLIKAAAPIGITMDDLFAAFVEKFGAKYKRSSMRALLWNQKDLGKIENQNGRYVIAAKGQDT
jgi:hypothetical protein